MRLTSFSDYALRLLIHAARHPVRRAIMAAAARGVSRGHLTRAANVPGRAPFQAADDPRLIRLYDWPAA
ncbi:hypothetical protein [uncultured Paracoccus sp.]|uniref:hypothetical protein n=1 Tax=uncultured Paracoccus sp. TaxID=189685 RepID=UPI0025DDE9EC|nr:hypothetical protein [uncultured Paracoccus sp.]